MIDLKDKMYFLLDYNFRITYETDDPTFIEYLFRYNSSEISEYIESVIEYYMDELPVLIDKIQNFYVFKPGYKDIKYHLIVNFIHSIEYLNQKNFDDVKTINTKNIKIEEIKKNIKDMITFLNHKIEIIQQRPNFCHKTLDRYIRKNNNNNNNNNAISDSEDEDE